MTIVFALIGLVLGGAIAEFARRALVAPHWATSLACTWNSSAASRRSRTELARLARERFSAKQPAGACHPSAAGSRRHPHPPRAACRPAAAPPPMSACARGAGARCIARCSSRREQPAAAAVRCKTLEIGATSPEEPALLAWVRDYFTGGNLVVRIGVIVLFFGVAFLLKFAADRNMLPIELRLAGVALGGAALLVIGWRLRVRLRAYALALQGGGVGLLYLTVFAALRLYDLLPPTVAFALMVVVAALSAFLAIGQNSMALAALGAHRRFPRARARVHRAGQSRGAVHVLRVARCGHRRHRVVQGLAAAQPAGLRVHLCHRHRLGRAALCAGEFLEHRAIRVAVLRDVRRRRGVVRAAPRAATQGLRRRHAGVRHARDDHAAAVRAGATSALCHGVQRAGLERRVSRARRRRLAPAPRTIAHARGSVPGVGGRIPHARGAVGARWSLDRGHLGAGRRGHPLDRFAPGSQARDRLRRAAAARRGVVVPRALRRRPGPAAPGQ